MKNSHKSIHIKLNELTQTKRQLFNGKIAKRYVCFAYDEQFYFSSCLDEPKYLNQDIVIPIKQKSLPDHLNLMVWKNQMVMYIYEIDISELRTRISLKKKHQIEKYNILHFSITLLDSSEIIFSNQFIQSISQHYLMIKNIKLKKEKEYQNKSSYYVIETSNNRYILPTYNSIVYIQLPQSLIFSYYLNDQNVSKSKKYASDELNKHLAQILLSDGLSCKVEMQLMWGINLYGNKLQKNLLAEAHEILIYDLSIKIETQTVLNNCSLKIKYGSKVFEIDEIHVNGAGRNKFIKFKKIVHFIIKSQDEEFHAIIERKERIVAYCRIYTDEVQPFDVGIIKKNMDEIQTGKLFGVIKFKSEKGKNLSTPANNALWRDNVIKKKNPTGGKTLLINISQLTVNYDLNVPVIIVIKSQEDQRTIPNVRNLNFFQPAQIPKLQKIQLESVSIYMRSDEQAYLMVRKMQTNQSINGKQNQSDFLGITVLNPVQVQLGVSCVTTGCYHNQKQTCTLNFIANKIPYEPFVKSIFQTQHNLLPPSKSLNIFLIMKSIVMTPFFYTYIYDRKNQLYCIVQVNRTRKVLILDKSDSDDLYFVSVAGSDTLNFVIDNHDYIRVKLTFLISDIGHEQQIYGTCNFKIRTAELSSGKYISVGQILILNDYGLTVGQVRIQARRPGAGKEQGKSEAGPFKSQIRKVKEEIQKVNESVRKVEKSLSRKNINQDQINFSLKKNNRYSQKKEKNYSVDHDRLKLPKIAKYKKNSLQDLVQNMRIRKRNDQGRYSNDQGRYSNDQTFQRNIQIKTERSMKQEDIRKRINNYQQKLRVIREETPSKIPLFEQQRQKSSKRQLINHLQFQNNELKPNLNIQEDKINHQNELLPVQSNI